MENKQTYHVVHYGNKATRRDYSKVSSSLNLPDLVEIQTAAFEWFLKDGIKEVFDDRSATLDESNVHALDDMTISKAIVEFRPFVYDDVQHKCSAYLNRAKIWVVDDWFSEGDMSGMVPDTEDIPF